jgi:hypothetical protein
MTYDLEIYRRILQELTRIFIHSVILKRQEMSRFNRACDPETIVLVLCALQFISQGYLENHSMSYANHVSGWVVDGLTEFTSPARHVTAGARFP